MKTISAGKLKDRWLEFRAGGESVLITEDGKPVAKLVPVADEGGGPAADPRFMRLAGAVEGAPDLSQRQGFEA
ncbi:MAG: type II toxin-antitoxin system Phd/YefM family antitoxin [Opitutales bacterium]